MIWRRMQNSHGFENNMQDLWKLPSTVVGWPSALKVAAAGKVWKLCALDYINVLNSSVNADTRNSYWFQQRRFFSLTNRSDGEACWQWISVGEGAMPKQLGQLSKGVGVHCFVQGHFRSWREVSRWYIDGAAGSESTSMDMCSRLCHLLFLSPQSM